MARVLFVHGIWQGRITRDELANEVWKDLRSSFRIGRDEVDAPTYGSCYRRPGQMAASGRDILEYDDLEPDALRDPLGHEELDEELLAFVSSEQFGLKTPMGADLQALGVGALADARFSHPIQALAIRLICQVRNYLLVPAVRQCVKRRIDTAIGPETEVVIAHSLGSVVAYEVLCERGQQVPLLVTLGSPLGLPSIMKRVKSNLDSAVRQPQVAKWVNFGAADDPVSIRQHLASYYSGVKDYTLPAGKITDIPHLRSRYLATSPVAELIGQALQ